MSYTSSDLCSSPATFSKTSAPPGRGCVSRAKIRSPAVSSSRRSDKCSPEWYRTCWVRRSNGRGRLVDMSTLVSRPRHQEWLPRDTRINSWLGCVSKKASSKKWYKKWYTCEKYNRPTSNASTTVHGPWTLKQGRNHVRCGVLPTITTLADVNKMCIDKNVCSWTNVFTTTLRHRVITSTFCMGTLTITYRGSQLSWGSLFDLHVLYVSGRTSREKW